MNYIKTIFIALFFMTAVTCISAASETDIKGSMDHALIPRMPGFYISSYTHVELGNGKFIGQDKKASVKEGRKTTIEYRLAKDLPVPGELKIRRVLQEEAKRIGGLVLFDDNFNRCSTFVILKDGRETWMDVRAYDKMYRLTIVDKAIAVSNTSAFPGKSVKEIDPALLPDNASTLKEKMPVVPNSWPEWIKSAKKSVRSGLPQWSNMLLLRDGIVNGAIVTEGWLQAPSLYLMLSPPMMVDGVPNPISKGLMEPLSEAVSFWASSVRVPYLVWYPSFIMVPSPIAPPTKSVATRLADLIQFKAFLEPSILTINIQSRLGKDGETPEARAAVKEFCDWFYKGFSFWLNMATIRDVEGTGPVPSYNPSANVFGGPVVNGTATGGYISPAPSWFEP